MSDTKYISIEVLDEYRRQYPDKLPPELIYGKLLAEAKDVYKLDDIAARKKCGLLTYKQWWDLLYIKLKTKRK